MKDLLVIGAGPAGLAAAIAAAQRGFSVEVLERRSLPADKACGEGILPRGLAALTALGVRPHLDPEGCAAIHSIRWLDASGARAEARLRGAGGLGVRRTALSAALLERARALGVAVHEGCEVRAHRRGPREVVVDSSAGQRAGRLLVAADGLASPVRAREGWLLPGPARRRFGVRRHFARAAWSDAVEVHFADGAEAYVTPAGPGRVGVALLFEEEAPHAFEELLARFPALQDRLAGAPFDSAPAGAGPLEQRVSRTCADRLVLLGDAAGYADAITGEGLSLAFASALSLARELPAVLDGGATRAALRRHEREARARYRRYQAVTRLVLALSRRPPLRRRAIALLGASPHLFGALVHSAIG
ncbi:MAG TPA: FAD-dependent oxidoreductase [Anaeromyxobacteraceae bacterium]|nr:FAD-dependent oxidoreductase [Anaeromyxobacteraceae bacterium]